MALAGRRISTAALVATGSTLFVRLHLDDNQMAELGVTGNLWDEAYPVLELPPVPPPSESKTRALLVIVSKTNEESYWSNEDGWVDRKSASLFTPEEKATLNLPMDGDWKEAEFTCDGLGNQHGYLCPKCRQGDSITIAATVRVNARLFPDGTDNDGGDTEWDDTDTAECGKCGFSGQVRDLWEVEMVD
jgi:Zn ribbon nucleic-acid-binding protein